MPEPDSLLTMKNLDAWTALNAHKTAIDALNMRELFDNDHARFERFSLTHDELLLDYSKNRITDETVGLLIELALARDLDGQRRALFEGAAINTTENRPVLHMALRGRPEDEYRTAEGDVSGQVSDCLRRMGQFVEAVHSGSKTGSTGGRLTDVVNIGIGGSHLGPEMVTAALAPYHHPDISVHFVSNVDGHDLAYTLAALNPETTLFLIASKTFTTQETMTNAHSAHAWLTQALGDEAVADHFVAISTNPDAAVAFGINPEHIFEFWDWVGGRFSLWSSIGLSIALAVGMEHFRGLLSGARQMDLHFKECAFEENLPVLMALVGIWNINFQNLDTLAVLPYDQRLARLPAFLQQLDMESNGKGVHRFGEPANEATGPVVFGEPGTNGQHAFYQLLHQGPKLTPADFIVIAEPDHGLPGHHDQLLANALAQSEALMKGRSLDQADGNPHRVSGGNRPSNTILLRQLDPTNLGKLIALYEHKIFVQGIIWDINSFDQWGVELGKHLAGNILDKIEGGEDTSDLDGSTAGLLNQLEAWRD
jgi:glucose-6-phosphate isomerase